MPAIEGIALSKSFGGVKALRSASFAADGGEVHALVGENGAGKSTLIKLLSGLYPPDAGEIRVDDAAVTFARPQAALASGIGTVFQELTLLPYMTVAENVLLGREPLRGPFIARNKLAERARELFAAAGIGGDAGIEPLELVGNLSLARQQIVEIVKTVSRRPRIVFMDEPTSALAEHSVAWLFGLINGCSARASVSFSPRIGGTRSRGRRSHHGLSQRRTGRHLQPSISVKAKPSTRMTGQRWRRCFRGPRLGTIAGRCWPMTD